MLTTRFAPSPTGLLHVGNIRVALVNWLYAKANNGKFILRIDDTDKARSSEIYITAIKKDLEWLGINWDDCFLQSSRMERYEKAKQKLIDDGRLYPCYETQEELAIKKKNLLSRNLPPIYDRAALKLSDYDKSVFEKSGIKPHWRFMLKPGQIHLNDKVRGLVEFDTSKLSDPVLVRADGTMTYAIASVLDDIEFNITDIIRGEDHISNSAIHIQMFEALGGKPPNFAHISLLKSKDGEMSKRLGGFDIKTMRENGIEPMAINSFLSKLGTSDSPEIQMTPDALIEKFSLGKFGRAPANYDYAELLRLNAKFLHLMKYSDVKNRLDAEEMSDVDEAFWECVKPNLEKFDDVRIWRKICNTKVEPVLLDLEFTKTISKLLPSTEFSENTWDEWISKVKNATGRSAKDLFLPIRLAITGLDNGPELKKLLPLLGRDKVLARLNGSSA